MNPFFRLLLCVVPLAWLNPIAFSEGPEDFCLEFLRDLESRNLNGALSKIAPEILLDQQIIMVDRLADNESCSEQRRREVLKEFGMSDIRQMYEMDPVDFWATYMKKLVGEDRKSFDWTFKVVGSIKKDLIHVVIRRMAEFSDGSTLDEFLVLRIRDTLGSSQFEVLPLKFPEILVRSGS